MTINIHPPRTGDRLYAKIVSLLPLLIALVTVIAYATTVKNKVDEQAAIAQDHEMRIRSLENSMSDIKSDTGRLVQELLDNKK